MLILKQVKYMQGIVQNKTMNLGSKIFHYILSNCIYQCIKMIIHHDQVGFTPDVKGFEANCGS
jgi:hypothetical protein